MFLRKFDQFRQQVLAECAADAAILQRNDFFFCFVYSVGGLDDRSVHIHSSNIIDNNGDP